MMHFLRRIKRKPIKKFFHNQNNFIVVGTITSVILAIIVSIPIDKTKISTKTMYCISMPGKILMNLLKMMILPLLVLSLVSGLISLNISTSGKLGLYTILYYVLTTFIAVCLGMALVVVIHPGRNRINVNVDADFKKVEAIESILDLFNNLFPDNIVRSTFQQVEIRFINKTLKSNVIPGNGNNTINIEEANKKQYKIVQQVSYANIPNFLGLIFFSVFFGMVLNLMGDKGELLRKLINVLNDLTMMMVEKILLTVPFGIFFLILSNLLSVENLEDTLKTLGLFIVTVLTGLTIHMFIVLPVIYVIFTRKNPYTFMYGMSRALLVGFITESSSATLPVTMNCAEQNNNIDPRITKFMFPIGAVINMDGTGLYEAVAAIFIAQINQIPLNAMQLVRISFTSTLAAIGAATVPSAGLITLLIVLSTAGLPTHQVSLLFTFDWFLDRCRTILNILGDAYGGGIVQSLCKEDMKKITSFDQILTAL